MDFAREIQEIGTFLTTAGFPFAVVGGVALAGYGHALLDLERDLPTTQGDVRVLRELRRQTPSWLDLGADEIEALIPPGALERRPPTSSRRRPFSLK